jgi:hypothetical protein
MKTWRPTDNGGSQSFLDIHCNEFVGDDFFTGKCGDWVTIGADLTSNSFGSDKNPPGQYIVATSRPLPRAAIPARFGRG